MVKNLLRTSATIHSKRCEKYWDRTLGDIKLFIFSSVNHITAGPSDGDRIPVGARFSAPVQTGPGALPAYCAMGTGSFLGVKCGRGVTLSTHPLLVPRSWKSRAILLPTLWATPGL